VTAAFAETSTAAAAAAAAVAAVRTIDRTRSLLHHSGKTLPEPRSVRGSVHDAE